MNVQCFDVAIDFIGDRSDSFLPTTQFEEDLYTTVFIGVEFCHFILSLQLTNLVQKVVSPPCQLEIKENVEIIVLATLDSLNHLAVGRSSAVVPELENNSAIGEAMTAR